MERTNKIRQEIQQQNETLKLENNNLQNHISNYAQSLKEKSKELEAMEHLSKENQYLHKREAFLCNQLINQTELFNKLKNNKVYRRPTMARNKRKNRFVIR